MSRENSAFALVAAMVVFSIMSSPGRAADKLPLQTKLIEHFDIASQQERFGALTFLGGLDLVSTDRRFGGISGVEITPDGETIWLLGDRGHLIEARLISEDGRLISIEDAVIEDIALARSVGRGERDFEDLALASDGTLFIAREARNGSLARLRKTPGKAPLVLDDVTLPGLSSLARNKGIESLAILPVIDDSPKRALALAERPAADSDQIDGWIADLSGRDTPQRLKVLADQGFDITSARLLPNGDLLLLERRTGALLNSAARLRRIPGADVVANAELDGEVIFEADLSHQIDNMEGLAVHQDANGRTLLTLVSDDNFSILQRTLILQFELEP